MAILRGPGIVKAGLQNSWDLASERSFPSSGDNNPSGTTVYDLAGSNNLTVSGTPTFSNVDPGDGQGFITFADDQTSQYLSVANYPIPTAAGTYEIWCRSNDTSQTQALMSYAVSSDNNENLLFHNNTTIGWGLYGPDGALTSNQSIANQTWTQVVRTSLRSTGAEKLYHNGSNVYNGTLAAGTNFTTGGTLVFGQESDSVGGGFSSAQCWIGDISLIRIYNRVLSADEILQNYYAQKSRFGI